MRITDPKNLSKKNDILACVSEIMHRYKRFYFAFFDELLDKKYFLNHLLRNFILLNT